MSVKIAVIGVGNFGKNHLKDYVNIENAEVIGAVDINPARAEEMGKKYNVPYYLNHKEIIDKVDAVSIAVPTTSHFEVAEDFLKHGKDVLVEKPITETNEQAEKLIELAEKNNLILQVGHIERFNSAFLKADPNIDRDNVRFIESHRLAPIKLRSRDVAVVLDLMIHDIDIVLNIVNSDVKNVNAVGVPILHEDSVDIANVRLEFENGCVANITSSRVSQKSLRKLRIFQKDAYFSVDFQDQKLQMIKKPPVLNQDMLDLAAQMDKNTIDNLIETFIKASEIKIEKKMSLEAELRSFLQCVETRVKPKVTGLDGLNSLKIASEILKQIDERLKKDRILK